MKLVSGLALASASLLSLAAHAAAPDPAPTLAGDGQGGTILASAHHLNGAAFSLIVTDWWLTGALPGGPARDVRLMVEVHMPAYPLLDRAADAAGRKLDVIILRRGPSPLWSRKASERVAVVLPRDYADKARATGLDITVSGKDRSFPVAVPAEALAHFLDSYAQAAGKATAAPSPPAPGPAAPVAAPPPAPIAQPAPAPAAPPPVPSVQQQPAPPPVAPTPPPPIAPPAAPAPQAAPVPEDDDPAVTPLQDKRVRLPNGQFAPTPPSAPAPAPTPPPAAAPEEEAGGHGTWIDALGLEFVATSSGAMVLTTKPGSIAAAKGIQSGDFIEGVDGVPIKTLDAEQMAARIGAPGVRVLHMIAAGDVKLR